MKLELVGINKEETYGAGTANGPSSGPPGPAIEPERKTLIVARFCNLPDGTYVNIHVPYEIDRGAGVRDVITLHLERRLPVTGANN